MLDAMVTQMTPMVAAVPKAVPVRAEIRQHSRKVISTITPGLHTVVAW